MNAEQKRAWLAVISVIGFVVLFAVLAPFFGAKVAISAFAVLSVNALAPLIGRKDPVDERDRSIGRRATVAGAMCSYLGFYAACMGVWFVVFIHQGRQEVSVHVFPIMALLAGMMPLLLARAVAVLVLYGRHTEADDV